MRSPGNSRRAPRTTYALTDITTPVSGLFRVGELQKPKLEATEVIVEHDGVEVSYTTPWRLGAEEWRVFLAVCALGGLDGTRFNGDTPDLDEPLPTLWDRFITQGMARSRDALNLRTTAYALLKEIGQTDSGKNRRALSDRLERLSTVLQSLRKGNRIMSGSRLLSFAHDEDSGELCIGLSPQMARAILGESKQYVRISLVETRRLGSPAAVLLQGYFSARIRAGASAMYPIDDLAVIVYGSGPASEDTKRYRRSKIREALRSFADVTTWQITFEEHQERKNGRSAKKSYAKVHRVSKRQLERWEAEYRADLMPPPRNESEPEPAPDD